MGRFVAGAGSALVCFFVVVFAIQAVFGQPEKAELEYRIKPVPAADRTNLDITLRYRPATSGPVNIKLPTDCFGTPDISRYVISLDALAGTTISPGGTKLERTVKPSPDGSVALRYVLSYDPVEMDKYPYAPNTGPDYFHLGGCQWMLHVGDDSEKRRMSVEIVAPPTGWKLYSSIDKNAARFQTSASYKELVSSAIGGGTQSHTFEVKGKPVSVFIHGQFDIPNKEIFSAVERIVRLQRDWFEDYEQPFYHVIVAPRSGVTAGYAPKNAFINFVRKTISPEQLNLLLAHEMFHFWLPNKIKIVQPDGYSDVRYEWFFEGFTDYFAPKILREAGLITSAEFAGLMNKAVLNIADNPHRSKTYDDMIAAVKERKFDGVYKRLSYYRGAVIALNWDAQIRRGGKGDLSDFIRRLFQLAGKTGGKISEQAFFDFAASYGIDAKGDLERYIMRGEPIRLSADARVDALVPKETATPLFDPGFSLEQTRATGKISGVVEGGPADRAGLRDGIEFVRAENSNRFSNSWQADQPLVVVVKIGAAERKIEFMPHGATERLMLFQVQ